MGELGVNWLDDIRLKLAIMS